jgi:hypothetical protein
MPSARFQLFTRRHATVEWRLISANNWELGRCPSARPDRASCLADVLHLQTRLDGGEEEIVPGPRGGWRWRLLVDGDVVAISSRSFQRRVECEATLRQFRKVAAMASVVPTVRSFC